MPYAANGQISTSQFDGAISITQAEYDAALAGMLGGKIVTVDGGFAVIDPPEPEPGPEPEPLTLEHVRAATAIDRALFCNRLADHQVLTDAEAISAAKGDWPEAMLFFLGFLTAQQQRDAQITWASCVTVERNHWLVLAMISMEIVTEAVADAVFGIVV